MTSVYYAGKPDAGLTRSSGLEEAGRKRVSAMRLRAALPSYTRTVTSMKKERRTAVLRFELISFIAIRITVKFVGPEVQ